MRTLVCVGALLVLVSAASGSNLVVNGTFSAGEDGWTRWSSADHVAPDVPWGGPFTWDASSGQGHLETAYGSFGWYQAITTVPGTAYQITADWAVDGAAHWGEILFFNDDGRPILKQLDSPLTSSMITKVDGWGMNGETTIDHPDLEPAMSGLYWHPDGPQTNVITATGTTIYVGLKAGTGGLGVDYTIDNIEVVAVPEPASLLLLGLPLVLVRRRRA